METSLDANNFIKVSSRSNGIPLLYEQETWWMESSLDAIHSEGQVKVTRGHPRSNRLPMLYEHETWWMESSLDAKIECSLK